MLILIFFLLICAGLLISVFFCRPLPRNENPLTPIAILPVTDASPSTKAFLEFYASQIAWMDSEILHTVLLIYPENSPSVQELCQEISRQYDFFSPVSFPQMENLLLAKLKNSEIF